MNPKKPKITPEQLSLFTEPVTDIYRELESDVFEMIAKRLKTSKDITKDTVFQWQIEKMSQLRMVNEETIKLLSKRTGKTEREIRKAIKQTGIITIDSIDYYLKIIYEPLPKPIHIDIVLEFLISGAFREYNNILKQSLITTTYGPGSVTDMYRKIIETSA